MAATVARAATLARVALGVALLAAALAVLACGGPDVPPEV